MAKDRDKSTAPAARTIAGGCVEPPSAKERARQLAEWLSEPSKAQVAEAARWVVNQLGRRWAKDKVIDSVLREARKLVAAPRGHPGKWRGPIGLQFVREVDLFHAAHPEMSKSEVFKSGPISEWMNRFGENVELESRYYEAKRYYKSKNPESKNPPPLRTRKKGKRKKP